MGSKRILRAGTRYPNGVSNAESKTGMLTNLPTSTVVKGIEEQERRKMNDLGTSAAIAETSWYHRATSSSWGREKLVDRGSGQGDKSSIVAMVLAYEARGRVARAS